MDITCFTPDELPTVLRVLRSVLEQQAGLDMPALRFLSAYARVAGIALPAQAPAPIAVQDVHIEDRQHALALLQLAAIAALLRVPVRRGAVDYLQALARQLGTHDPVLYVLRALLRGRRQRVRLAMIRRGMRTFIAEAHHAGGVPAVLRYFGALAFKLAGRRDRLSDYKRLGLLPEGTVGREFWKHMTRQGFGFPGEPGGLPPSITYHDVAHVLTGHGNDGAGEIQQACFQAGNRRHGDSFFFAVFGLLHFHHGLRLTPAGPAESGRFDPDSVLWALHRGARCSVDMTHQWDYWPLFPLQLDEARRRCGLLPPRPLAA